jgi:superkiller protein 3
MKLKPLTLPLLCASLVALPALAQNAAPDSPSTTHKDPARADAYYNFTMGHIYEQQYEQTGAAEYATRAIDSYKKAYAVDPLSPIIGERLAEMYWKAQRVHEAVTEANEVLKRNPDDLPTHRLLALVYLRSLGDINGQNIQSEAIVKAIQEYNAVHRLDPSDQEVTIWLARLYRLHNEPDKAEGVLRDVLKDDPENDAAVEQLTQLLLDQNKAEEAVSLLNGMIERSPSATLYDHLGDAYTQTHDFPEAEAAYRKAVELDPSELSHLRGLAQSLLSEEKYTEALTAYQKLPDMLPDDADT